MSGAGALEKLREVVARLRAPDGCPWDREQTHRSLRMHLIEEAYETAEAIDREDDAHFREELGDLLLQVVMHSQIASEAGRFDLEAVAAGIAEKLVRRHPHVFGGEALADSAAVLTKWEEIKGEERAGRHASVVDGVSAALPALMRAEKIQKRAARVGFDWSDIRHVVAKVREEVDELDAELGEAAPERVEEEIGDLLFSVVNLARKAKVDAELSLNGATEKFVDRFKAMEAEVAANGGRLDGMTLGEMDAVWDRVKRRAREELTEITESGGKQTRTPTSGSHPF